MRDEDGAAIAYDKLQHLFNEFIEQFEKSQQKQAEKRESVSSAMQKFFEEQFKKSQRRLQFRTEKSPLKTHTISDMMKNSLKSDEFERRVFH